MNTLSSGSSVGLKLRNFSLLLVAAGLLASIFADVQIYASEPWAHLRIMLQGLFSPSISDPQQLAIDLFYTLSFALIGVSLAAVAGLLLSLLYQHPLVRFCCAFFRAIHELFWALLFMQLFGLSASTAILAIAIPYACTFARVFHDIYQHAPIKLRQLPELADSKFSHFLYVLLPQVWPQMRSYLRYRFECGVRTSAVLGFVGLPTIGFHLETAFKQGDYSYAGALLLAFFLLIASIKYWLKVYLLPVYIGIALWFLPGSEFTNSSDNIWRFFSVDIWPAVIKTADQSIVEKLLAYGQWLSSLLLQQGLPGMGSTLLLSLMALAATAVLCVLLAPLLTLMRGQWLVNSAGQCLLLVMRSTPEYILAFVLLLLLGPSMLPAVIALAIHNSGLISFLLQRDIAAAQTSTTASVSFSDFLYKVMPDLYAKFISLLMYRAEIILRESAILGVLGVTTLGFYIDSAFEDLRFDRALALLFLTALLNVVVDQLSRKLQLCFSDQGIRVRSKD
ncbi:MAG: ABC transporter permease [Pseudomonadales bacterium]|nr:ABC transporter permease [Pseudomonadales bacterium]NRA16995.1 hypothetical protein [Oceanospirillaceae bacterium]